MALIGWATLSRAQPFAVASIKPVDPNQQAPPGHAAQMAGAAPGFSIKTTPELLTARNVSLLDLIQGAYGLHSFQIAGGPQWIAAARFNVEAKPSGPADRVHLLRMLRDLLAERFQLAFHKETRVMPIYALTIAKGGPKFHALAAGDATCFPHCAGATKLNHLHLRNLASLVGYLGADAGRPVVDQTGLTGDFDIDLDIGKIQEAQGSIESAPRFAGMFEATVDSLPGQLGLKLTPAKGPVEILVIDRAAKPGAN
jgi:uncharacterized protein (TIGR03435 family)